MTLRRFAPLFAALALLALPLRAELFSERFDFAQEKWIRLDAKSGDLEIQDIQFRFPSYHGPRKLGIKGPNEATVNIKNYGSKAVKLRVAVALFDASGNLVGCGTAGSGLGSAHPGERVSFDVLFENVTGHLSTAKTFYLTIESEPVG